MGKRGPKRGSGGRPVIYHDSYHLMHRQIQREYQNRLREQAQAEQDNSQFQVMRLVNDKK